MGDKTEYVINTDIKFAALEPFDVGQLAASCEHDWFNQTLCRVNDCVARLGVLKGEFHWHQHEQEDELFYVVEGQMTLEIEGRDPVLLGPKQALTVPRGVAHRPLCPGRCVVLMIEGATVTPTGD